MSAKQTILNGGIRLVSEWGAKFTRTTQSTSKGTSFFIQEAVNDFGKTKVVTFAEGSPMRKLGFTDSVLHYGAKGEPPVLRLCRGSKGFMLHEANELHLNNIGDMYHSTGLAFEGTLKDAKKYIEATKETQNEWSQFFENISPSKFKK